MATGASGAPIHHAVQHVGVETGPGQELVIVQPLVLEVPPVLAQL